MIIAEKGTITELQVDIISDRLVINSKFIEDGGFIGGETTTSIPMKKFKQFLKEINLNDIK